MADYISKEIAIKMIKRIKPCHAVSEYGAGYEQGLKEAIEILNTTPAADVQPVKRGRWISSGRDNDYNSYCRCSRCNNEIVMYRDSEKNPPNYCDNCGARMIKDGDTE